MKTKKIKSLKDKITEHYYKRKRQKIFSKIKTNKSNEEGYRIIEEIIDSLKKSE